MPIGTHTSSARTPVPLNPSDATPTTVKGCPLSLSVRPTMAGSLLNRRIQKPWLSTATGLAPGWSLSPAPNSRPTAGTAPSAVK